MELNYKVHQFKNGIRLIHKQVPHTRIAHCGFIIDIGSRDESEEEQGLAHFWEHMAFKGTHKRKSLQIINALERYGGDLNAYTTKEKICFYASLLDPHFTKAAQLLTDITFNANFPKKEIEKERTVILEEMSMYEDTPSEAIFDQFDHVVFDNHPLGKNILGTKDSVLGFDQIDFFNFIANNLDTERVVFSSVSSLPFKKVKKIMTNLLEPLPHISKIQNRRKAVAKESAEEIIYKPNTNQSHVIIGGKASSIHSADRLPLFLLANVLGGPSMNSRLNLQLRERKGWVYQIEAGVTPYTDTGIFSIYYASDPNNTAKCLEFCKKELHKLIEKPINGRSLNLIKQQLMGQLAMAEESNLGFMLMMGKSLLDLDRIEPLSEIFHQIENFTGKHLQKVATEYFQPEKLNTLIFQPKN